MEITALIAQHIIDVHEGDNWTDVNIENTLKDVSFQEAVTQTPASVNTIASILYHITFYNENMLERLQGKVPHINDANGFDMPELKDGAAWEELKERNIASARRLAEASLNVPLSKLDQPILPGYSSIYKSLHGIAEHGHYHLGQIVLLKNLIRNK